MSKHQLTATEEKLLKRGFDWATDTGGYDPSWDENDVLEFITNNPEALVKDISLAIAIPNHRVIAAVNRLRAAGKIPVNREQPLNEFSNRSRTKELEANYLKVVNPESCSTGNDEPVEVETANCEQVTVITLWQPWATFIAKGIKCFETRGWLPNYTGRILIHASASHKLNWLEVPLTALKEHYPDITEWDYPLGAIVADAELINCHRVEAVKNKLEEVEKLCGNYSDGRYAWELANVKPLFIPNVKGHQKLWKYELTSGLEGTKSETVEHCEQVTVKPDSEQFPEFVAALKSLTDEAVADCEREQETVDIPSWITGRNEAEAIALCQKLGFWYVGSEDEWEAPDHRQIIKRSGDWLFNYDLIGLFVEARCNGAIFNINTEEDNEEEDKELVNKAIAVITEAGKQWGEQFGHQLSLFDCEREQEQTTDLLFTEPQYQSDANGQLSIFWDTSDEPPDPDDYQTGEEYETAWDKWAIAYPHLAEAIARQKKDIAFPLNVAEKQPKTIAPQKLEEQTPLGPEILPEPLKANNSSESSGDTVRLTLTEAFLIEAGDYAQLKSDPRRIGSVSSIKNNKVKVRYADGFVSEHSGNELSLFSKEDSDVVLGESFFKVGEKVKCLLPTENRIFTVNAIYPTGMVSVKTGLEALPTLSYPANWLEHYIEKVEQKAEPIPLEQPKKKRPAKGCGSGYLKVREANVKRNAAKGKPPDVYYVYYYSYSNQFGKEIKSSISVPRAKVSQVKALIEKGEHYVKICKVLGKSVPCFY